MSTFVLVHGGWHGGWCWRRVATRLRAAGHEVHTPTLTGLGERAHLGGPATGLDTHIEDVAALLECEDVRDAVLVGHSSGGAVVTGVAQRVADRIAALVYLDAFVPRPGQSVLDLLPPARADHFRSRVDDAGRVVLDPEVALDGWGVRDPADRAWMAPRLTPYPWRALADPLPDLPVPDLPCTYVHCTDKPAGDNFARFAAAAVPPWRRETLATGHDSMVTDPMGVVGILTGPSRADVVRSLVGGDRAERIAAHDRAYHDDAVLEFPQSGERFEGVANFREWRRRYPSDVTFESGEVRGTGELWVMEGVARYDGGPPHYGVSVHEFRGDRIARETIYVSAGWDAPDWRAPWRAPR